MACPGNKLRFDLTVEEIAKGADKLMEKSRVVYDSIGVLKPEDISYDNFIKPLAADDSETTWERHLFTFPQHVSMDKVIRDASVEANKKLSEFDVEMSMRKDVFDNLVAAEQSLCDSLNPEAKRYLQRLIRSGKRNGLHLPKDTQDKIKEIKKRMSGLSIDYNQHCDEVTTVVEFTEEELVGLPESFIKNLDKAESGKLKVTLDYPDYYPCQKFAKKSATRKTLEKAFHSRCMEENVPIMEELVELSHKKADLLGYPTHAAYILETRMAKTPEKVQNFLADLAAKLQKLKEQEFSLFLKYKKEECEANGEEFDNQINMWDMRYYMARAEEREYSVDQNTLKQYFPIDVVTRGLLAIYQDLLSVTFEEVKGGPTWHKDVSLYSVTDKESSELMGYFYLDLFPREGKFSHAACFGLQPGCVAPGGSRQVAVSAVVANFTKPTKDEPSLLDHDEVVTFFHEFGHSMHDICSKAEFAYFSGSSVETDFVEAPSQMLENWCWEKDSLSRMSGHYKDNSPIPDDLMNSLIKSRTANAAAFNLRQIYLSTFDQTIFTKPKVDTAAVDAELSASILCIPSTPGTNMSASFAHLADGYDAQYYGYLWSEVFSADMFHSRFKKEGVMSQKVGMDYRRCILQPGGTADASEMLKNFLGREPLQESFLISKGLAV